MTESGREALSIVREWSGDPSARPECLPGYPGGVGMPSRISSSGLEALPDVREGSEDPPG